jgi:carboxypeptidase family protein
MRTAGRQALLLMVALLIAVSPAFAQKFTGTIQGRVTDPTGAVLPNAQITIKNLATGATRTATTNSDGDYTVPELEIGTYEVRATSANFKEAITKNVELHVSTTTTVNMQMQVGAATEVVSVEANAIQVQTSSAALGEIVDGTQVRELPLNGRSFSQLTQLQPGVSAGNNFDTKNKGLLAGVDFSVNGNPTTNNLFLVDGANNNDVGSNRTILIYPSVDAISEFKMLRNSYGPEYGQASGAVVQIATRSGSNAFHGSVLYFGRNDLLNAHEYFAARAEASALANGKKLPNEGKDKLRRNDYGYTIGGPILKDKLFFFWSQEWNKELRGQTRTACVPTAAERSGDFSQGVSCGATPPVDPTTGARILKIANPSPAGLLIAQMLPLPNLTTAVNGKNWVQSVGSKIDWRQENFRADYNLTKSQQIMFRYTQDHWDNPAPNLQGFWGDDPFPVIEGSWVQPSKQIVGKLTSLLGSSMVNDAAFAYSNNRINIGVGGTNPQLETQLTAAIPPVFAESLKNKHIGQPTIWGGLGPYGDGKDLWGIAPWNNDHDIYTFRDDLSKIRGSHAFKVGAFFGWDGKNEDTGFDGAERPQWAGVNTGDTKNALANILNPGSTFGMSESSTNTRAQLRWRDYEAYFGDTWKARSNLSVEYGVRYSILAPPFAANNKLARFDPKLYVPTRPASDACNGLIFVPGTNPCVASNQAFGTSFSSGTPGQSKSLMDTNYHAFAPRLGVSWDPRGNGSTAVRLGIGQFYQRERVSTQFVEVTNAPFQLNASSVNRPLDKNAAIGTPTTSPSGGRDPRALLPNSWQWNVSVEQGLAKDTALELGYVGNRSVHLSSSYDINQIPVQNRLVGAFCGSLVSCSSLRPFSNFAALTYWSHDGSSIYHSFQALFRTRYKRSQLQAAYTWSHSIADYDLTDSNGGGVNASSFTDNSNHRLDRGNSTINRPQIFVANAIFNLPTLNDFNPVMKGVAGGWELGIISTLESGNSITVFTNGVTDLNPSPDVILPDGSKKGRALNSLSGTGLNGNNRPNVVAGASCTTGAHDNQVFSPTAFTLSGFQIGSLGNAPRGYCHGPQYVNTDFAVYKNWSVAEKLRIQFRLEAFNFFNTPNFRGDQINTDFMSGGKVACGNAPCSPGGTNFLAKNSVITNFTPNSSFGQATGTKGGREIQYGLKFIF